MTLETMNPFFGLLIVGGVLFLLMVCCVVPMVLSARTLNKMEAREEEARSEEP